MHTQSLQPALCCVGSRSLKHQRMFVLSCFAGVLLAIVLRLGTGYRGPEMNGGCHSYLVQDVPCYWVCGRSISAPVTPPPGLLPVVPTHSCNRLAEALARHMLQKKVFYSGITYHSGIVEDHELWQRPHPITVRAKVLPQLCHNVVITT